MSNQEIVDKLYQIIMSDDPMQAVKDNEDFVFQIIPELKVCKGFNQNNPWHIYDVYEHILRVLNGVPKDLDLRLTALFHDAGKPQVYVVDDNGVGHFWGHWEKSYEIFLNFANNYGLDKDFSKKIAKFVYHHDDKFDKLTDKEMLKLSKEFDRTEVEKLFIFKRSDLLAHNPKFHYVAEEYPKQKENFLKKYYKD